jgi:hypothetical protein
MKAERLRAPDLPVERVGERDQRTRRVVRDDGADLADVGDRAVLDDEPVVVVDERIVERVDVDEAGECHGNQAADRAAAAKCAGSIGARTRGAHHVRRAGAGPV